MKHQLLNTKNFITLFSILIFSGMVFYAQSQVQVDKPILLTGTGANAKMTGVKSVTDSLDVVSVRSLQNGSLIYATDQGSANNFVLTLSPPISGYEAGMVFNFISDQTVTGPSTLNVNGFGAIPIKKYINQELIGCEIQYHQVVQVVYDGANFQMISVFGTAAIPPTVANAGPNQSNVIGICTLAADAATSGTGAWSILSGTGGAFADASNPDSTFTGLPDSSYVLQWSISNSCGVTSSSTVNISFALAVAYTTPGEDTFAVPSGVSSVSIQCWGAQGSTTSNGGGAGGLGGYATGNLAVNGGTDVLYIHVGGQGIDYTVSSANGGYNGGGTGAYSGGGGGGTDVRLNTDDLNHREIVAGGGGGAQGGSAGGAGGGTTGGAGSSHGGGGTQSGGGAGGGGFGTGANASGGPNAGGGGGGWWGGGSNVGCSCNTSGGGGSGYTGGVSGGSMQTGIQSGNGQVIINW